MTTGEKIAKLRKENNLTQEELADKLYVSRQAVSKWESNITFPDTEKIIELSKIFNCTIDYLLLNDNNFKNNGAKVNHGNTKKIFYKEENFITSIYTVGFGILMLLIYLIPILKVPINIDPIFSSYEDMYIKNNLYNLLEHVTEIGNVLILIVFFSTLAFIVIGVIIYFYPNNKKLLTTRFTLSIIMSVLWLLIIVIIFKYAYLANVLLILLLFVGNNIVLKVNPLNKYIGVSNN